MDATYTTGTAASRLLFNAGHLQCQQYTVKACLFTARHLQCQHYTVKACMQLTFHMWQYSLVMLHSTCTIALLDKDHVLICATDLIVCVSHRASAGQIRLLHDSMLHTDVLHVVLATLLYCEQHGCLVTQAMHAFLQTQQLR